MKNVKCQVSLIKHFIDMTFDDAVYEVITFLAFTRLYVDEKHILMKWISDK